MPKTKENFQLAQELYKQYFTHVTSRTLEDKIFDILGEEFNSTYFFENQVTPREFLNTFLQRNYPNEIIIKSNFINKVISKTKNNVTVFELNVGSSRVDLCKINGHNTTAYEIKTDLDSPQRLKNQMKDYFSVFEKVYLICPQSKISLYEKQIPVECGIYTYRVNKTGKYFFKLQKSATSSTEISALSQLSTFTKRELNMYFSCPNYDEKKKMFTWILEHHSENKINIMFRKQLKNKYSNQWDFLLTNKDKILEIDYQWFFKNQIEPEIVYQ